MKFRAIRVFAAVILCVVLPVSEAHEPIVIASGQGADVPKQPQAAIAPNGDVHAVFGIGDAVHYVTSRDGGATFESPEPAFRVPNMSVGMRRGPRIVATKDAIVVTAIGGKTGKGRDGDVLAWRSVDGGTEWQGPVRVNDVADSAREGLHAMASGTDGSIWCAWLDLRSRRTEIYATRSVDGGGTWEPNIRVYQSPDGSVCECCHPSVIVAKNDVHVMFRNSVAGNRDMYITSSFDGGRTFNTATKLGAGTWPLDACPMDGGMLAVSEQGKIETVWRRDANIYMTVSSDGPEILLGRGQQPWIAATEKGSFIAWTAGREGDLKLHVPGSQDASVLARNARDPMLVAPAGRGLAAGSGPVFCFWEAKNGDRVDIVTQRIDMISASSN